MGVGLQSGPARYISALLQTFPHLESTNVLILRCSAKRSLEGRADV